MVLNFLLDRPVRSCSFLAVGILQWLVIALTLPEGEHQDGELSGHGNHGFALGYFATSRFVDILSVASEIAVLSEVS